jgi:hypothetical protein
MSGVFISYRRSDSGGYAGRIFDRLRQDFGEDQVFRDIDTIPGGARFRDEIAKHLKMCNIVLVIIGPSWLDALDETGRRRLDDPEDWVRIEVSSALSHKVSVIPVTVGGAALPAAKDLPEDLRSLVQYQRRDLRDGDTWNNDLQLLVRSVANELGIRRANLWPTVLVAMALAAIMALGVLYVVRSRDKLPIGSPTAPPEPAATNAALPAAPPAALTVTGKWTTPVLTNPYAANETFTLLFDFEMFGDKLTGSVTDTGYRFGLFDGKFTGDVVSFYTQSEVQSGGETKPFKIFYNGKLTGDQIEFTRHDDLSNGGIPLKFVATRAPNR